MIYELKTTIDTLDKLRIFIKSEDFTQKQKNTFFKIITLIVDYLDNYELEEIF